MNSQTRMFMEKYKKGSKYNRVQFRTYEDLDKIWDDDKNCFLRFRYFATHSFSGYGKVFTHNYFVKKHSIKEGSFEFANSFKIE